MKIGEKMGEYKNENWGKMVKYGGNIRMKV